MLWLSIVFISWLLLSLFSWLVAPVFSMAVIRWLVDVVKQGCYWMIAAIIGWLIGCSSSAWLLMVKQFYIECKMSVI